MSLGTNKNLQVPIHIERRIITDTFDYEIEGCVDELSSIVPTSTECSGVSCERIQGVEKLT